MPGPLSWTTTRKRPSPFVSSASLGLDASSARSWTSMCSSGRRPASSQASSELSTASLMVVRRALEGLSKPSRWRFLTKNSETEISRCPLANVSALTRREGVGTGRGPATGAEAAGGAGAGGGAGEGAGAFFVVSSFVSARPASASNSFPCRAAALATLIAPCANDQSTLCRRAATAGPRGYHLSMADKPLTYGTYLRVPQLLEL